MKNLIITLLYCICFFSCSKKEEEPKTCPDGYYGDDCELQLTPIITVKSITVTFPPTNNGASWDLTSGPDIFIVFSSNNMLHFLSQGAFIQNASGAVTIPMNKLLDDAKAVYDIQVYDYDDLALHDFMGRVLGEIYTDTTGFPPNVTLSCTSCPVSATLALEYAF